jgi:hypothetical protein
MADKTRATVILQPRTIVAIRDRKAQLLQRGIDLNTGQLFKLGLYLLNPVKVSAKDVDSVIEEDGRRTQHATCSSTGVQLFQEIGRVARKVKGKGERK